MSKLDQMRIIGLRGDGSRVVLWDDLSCPPAECVSRLIQAGSGCERMVIEDLSEADSWSSSPAVSSFLPAGDEIVLVDHEKMRRGETGFRSLPR